MKGLLLNFNHRLERISQEDNRFIISSSQGQRQYYKEICKNTVRCIPQPSVIKHLNLDSTHFYKNHGRSNTTSVYKELKEVNRFLNLILQDFLGFAEKVSFHNEKENERNRMFC